jgi:hypothetical protein
MKTNISIQKENARRVQYSSEAIHKYIYPNHLDINITEGSEFLDDAIRMTEQPFVEPTTNKNE